MTMLAAQPQALRTGQAGTLAASPLLWPWNGRGAMPSEPNRRDQKL